VSGQRRRQSAPRGRTYDDYAGQARYGGGTYEPGYYEYGHPYDRDYQPEGGDDWWEEGTGGLFSPIRVLLGLLVIGAGAVVFYGMFLDRTPLQIPITVGGLAVLGLALVMLAFSSASGAASLGRRGYGGKALIAAIFGGLCAMAGFGSLAGAVVLGMLTASA
jgi:hypothetical protein